MILWLQICLILFVLCFMFPHTSSHIFPVTHLIAHQKAAQVDHSELHHIKVSSPSPALCWKDWWRTCPHCLHIFGGAEPSKVATVISLNIVFRLKYTCSCHSEHGSFWPDREQIIKGETTNTLSSYQPVQYISWLETLLKSVKQVEKSQGFSRF